MAKYILNENKQDSESGENHELHNEETCTRLPYTWNRLSVGYFNNCTDAKQEAKRKYPQYSKDIDGCYYCSPACHNE